MSKFVFVLEESQEEEKEHPTYICDWDAFYEEIGWDPADSVPCYHQHYVNTGYEDSRIDIYALMCWVSQKSDPGVHLVSVSVNSNESRFEDWLHAASQFPEATVFLTSKDADHRDEREIAMISWPTVRHFNR